MIIEKNGLRPFKWMVIDNRLELMKFCRTPHGGFATILAKYLEDNFNLHAGKDYDFLDHRTRGNVWHGTFYSFRNKKDAETFDNLFGDKPETSYLVLRRNEGE